MSQDTEKHPIRGILAGVAGGLFASWVMNEFLSGPGQKLTKAIQTPEDKEKQERHSDEPDSTMKVADAVGVAATGGQHLTHEQQEKGGPIVHYAFGALAGGLYGALAEYSEVARSGFGISFGTVLFAGADLLAVPALHLSPPLKEQPKSSFANYFAAHLVYGATTELVRRITRKVL